MELAGDSPHWVWVLLGRLHPLVVHFPIALLLCAALGELLVRLLPTRVLTKWPDGLRADERRPSDVVLCCLVLGAASAAGTSILGWLDAASQSFSGPAAETLQRHRVLGLATVAASVGTALLALRLRRRSGVLLERVYRVGLLASAVAVSGAGHYGARLVFGSSYLLSALPGAGPPATDVAELPDVERPVDFARHVRPIFEEACFECHGPEKQKGRLRLDARHLALGGGKSGRAIVAGDLEASELVRRILGAQGSDRRMPLDRDPLAPAQIARIRAWIEEGAAWPDEATVADAVLQPHWAYVAPERPEPPAVRETAGRPGWARNPIDAFVLARMREKGLEPAPEAERAALIRRASLDLTGLPPTPEQVRAFEADPRPDAWERVVERLLASPHYGERWASFWLDLARYADSDGHDRDNGREIWRYRDWVVDAFNRDLPFDRFTVEQIAGDLLPEPTVENLVATGFHRNTMFNREAGIHPDEAHWEVLVDRVATTGTVWLGSTLACAQCHDHEYDPFTQADFYSFLAFFNGAERTERTFAIGDNRPVVTLEEAVLELPTPPEAAALARLRTRLAELERRVDRPTPELRADQREWEARVRAEEDRWVPLDVEALASRGGATLAERADGSIVAGGANPPADIYTVRGAPGPGRITALRLELLADPALPGGGPGRYPDGGFVLTGFDARLGSPGRGGRPLPLAEARADASSPYHAAERLVAGRRRGSRFDGWSAEPGRSHQIVFRLTRPVRVGPGERLTVGLYHGRDVIGGLGIGRFRLATTSSDDPFATLEVPEAVRAALATPRSLRTADEAEIIARHYRSVAPRLAGVREEIERTRRLIHLLGVDTTLVMRDATRDAPLSARIREGGSYTSPGERVPAAVPDFLHPLPDDAERDRLALARWLVDPRNPLVARVTVNRFWERLFGAGLVRTVDDFGARGEEPTHPELLDWLATEFVEGGWSMKGLLRLLVTSATYRQSPRVTAAERARDPGNRWLARATRRRLAAEHVRDAVLASTGLLDPRIGGPPVFPYQPEGVWRFVFSRPSRWATSEGSDRYRRGLYTYWRRTALHPMLVAFDAPSREVCVGRREPTDTPLQALALLNAPTVRDASRHLAGRLLAMDASDRERARDAFRRILARAAEPEELDRLLDSYREQHDHFRERAAAARKVAGVAGSEGSPSLPDAERSARAAAWTLLVTALLNLDEAITTP